MKAVLRPLLCVVSMVALFAAGVVVLSAAAPEGQKGTSSAAYDEQADGKKQIAEALAAAKPGHKRVLLQFGENACGWCRKLHGLFRDDAAIAAELKAHYVVVFVDVNGDHNKDVNEKYGTPTNLGMPALVVLDADGKQIKTQSSTELEEGSRHSPAKVLAFLKTWSGVGGK